MVFERIIVLVLDSVGVGEGEDANEYGDWGANTLLHTLQSNPGLSLPNLEALGLRGVLFGEKGEYKGCYGRMKELSKGKDSINGHWEMMGVVLEKPFPTYPNGFPREVIDRFESITGRKAIGNKPASGTEIIKEYFDEHKRTGNPIVYTSADSVFQIAAHNDVISLEELYKMCEIARNEVCVGDHAVARVIARPFVGDPLNGFRRTSDRRDYSLKPVSKTVLDVAKENGYEVLGVGKIHDLFAGEGLTASVHTESNMDGIDKMIEALRAGSKGIIFVNLVEFDANWGHRRDFKAYGKGLKDVDDRLPEIIDSLKDYDLLIITADHGCDPTFKSHTDHTREIVPLLTYGKKTRENVDLGYRSGFVDIGATISECLSLPVINGKSFYKEIIL